MIFHKKFRVIKSGARFWKYCLFKKLSILSQLTWINFENYIFWETISRVNSSENFHLKDFRNNNLKKLLKENFEKKFMYRKDTLFCIFLENLRFLSEEITFTLGFSLGQHHSGNLQPFGGKNYPNRLN